MKNASLLLFAYISLVELGHFPAILSQAWASSLRSKYHSYDQSNSFTRKRSLKS